MEVRHVRLINGEELLAQLKQEDDGSIVLLEPYAIEEQTGENGSLLMTLTRYVPYSVEEVSIEKTKILTITPVMAEFERYYRTSMKYNKMFVEPKMEAEVSRISRMMENIIDQEEGTRVRRANGEVFFVHPGFLGRSDKIH